MLRLLGALLRLYSYIFEAVLCLIAIAFSAVLLASPHEQVRLGWLPWTGDALGAALAVFGLLGLLILVLAIAGRVRFLLTLFALTAFVIVTRGLFFTPYRFSGAADARNGLWFSLALFAAFLGAIPLKRRERGSF